MRRAAAFLLLADSRASFGLEGERPPHTRALRWGWAAGEAGRGDLTIDGLLGPREALIGDGRFTLLGLRTEGGWIGRRDRATGAPVPEHVGARPGDLTELMRGVVEYGARAERSGVDPVVTAVERTVIRDLPREVGYLERHDEFSARIQEEIADMPDGTIDLLTRFLARNRGRLSERARGGEFRLLTAPEVERVEALYAKCFADAEFR